MALTVHDWMIERDSSPESLPPPEPPSANSLSIPDEAYGASTAYAIDPTLPLGPNDWDEADRANAARVDELNNEFIDLRNGILHDGDDAFFNRTGRDAILVAPEVHAKLEAARQETLGRAANDVQRQWLNETLGKHKIGEHFDIADHAGRQSVAWQKSVNRGRLDRLNQQAGRDHADPKMVEALANASEGSARDHARASGLPSDSPEAQAEVDSARLSVYRHAIEASLAKNQPRATLALYEKANVPRDGQLAAQMKDLAIDVEAEDWIQRHDDVNETTAAAALSASDLSPQAQRRAFQKVQQQIASTENARVAEVERLDVAFTSATKDLAIDPSSYRRGTLASLADSYQRAGETDTGGMLRAQAEQESFILGYAQSPAQAQQRILDTLPESENRTLLHRVGQHQTEAFAKDPWTTGTSVYPDVGAPKPLSDLPGRVDQARLISKHRDGIGVLPFSGDEISKLRKELVTAPPEQQTNTLKELATSLPPTILPPLAAALAGKNGSDDFQSRSLVGALSFNADDAPEIAEQVLRGARLTQQKAAAGKSVTATTNAWKDALRERLGDAPVPPIVRDTIANLYTDYAERAGQGDEIDTSLLDKAIIITRGNVVSQSEIVRASFDAETGFNGEFRPPSLGAFPSKPLERREMPVKPQSPLPLPPAQPIDPSLDLNLRIAAEEYRKILEERHEEALKNYEEDLKNYEKALKDFEKYEQEMRNLPPPRSWWKRDRLDPSKDPKMRAPDDYEKRWPSPGDDDLWWYPWAPKRQVL